LVTFAQKNYAFPSDVTVMIFNMELLYLGKQMLENFSTHFH